MYASQINSGQSDIGRIPHLIQHRVQELWFLFIMSYFMHLWQQRSKVNQTRSYLI